MAGSSRWEKLVSFQSRLQNLSLNDVRKALTKGLELRVDHAEVRRGEGLQADVLITSRTRLGDLEVGVVCTEHYDVRSQSDKGSHRLTFTATEHEAWIPLQSMSGWQRVRLPISAGAPFSYQGSCLSYTWEVVVRGRRRRALDKRASRQVLVRP